MVERTEVLGSKEELVLRDKARGRIKEHYDYETRIEEIWENQIVYRDKPYTVERAGRWNKVIDEPSVEVLGIVSEGPYENEKEREEVRYRTFETEEEPIERYLEETELERTDLENLLGWS